MQYAGGILLPPVQTLVATIIFAKGKNANESLTHPNREQFLGRGRVPCAAGA